MLFGNPKLYARAREAKLGKASLSGPLEDLRVWVNSRYSINVLDIVYDSIELGPHEGRPRLNLIIETTGDYDQLHKDSLTLKPSIKRSILNRFSRIVSASPSPKQFNTDNVHLITDDFSREAIGRATEQFLRNDSQTIVVNFPDANIWDISGFSGLIVVFYHTEDDIVGNQKNGQSDAIRQSCYEKVKPYDEFRYLTPDKFSLKFDSKQNVDENYKGSMFYYWR
ncbi:hypothetical protein Pan153_30980 [Gimesia panareensis]|uniref:Uncharacterized protein n=1 Tax=Gimesia panareensis TaxID=2527978 RepID=A0A518FQ82_9PLAN|nr:hypothetical protein [Gimesia panareensis]QDV18440.1 hypothetical protein Pan153_30980 [Gimesia panareensis]